MLRRILFIVGVGLGIAMIRNPLWAKKSSGDIRLPQPALDGGIAVEKTIAQRRSIRDFQDTALSLQQLSQLLWSAQGITDPAGLRAAPSAGALYPLELYVVAGRVESLPDGIYKYDPAGHALKKVVDKDKRVELASASLGQTCVRDASISLVMTAVYERMTRQYGSRGRMYVHMEAGHAAQNVYLQAESLGLGTVAVGAFQEDQVQKIIGVLEKEIPIYILPVGRPR